MQLPLQAFATMVADGAAYAQGAATAILDASVGSVTRAILEAVASLAGWLQYLILLVMNMTRLATSQGSDVDTWVADYGLTRLPGVQATGLVTLASLSPASQAAVVPLGAVVKTADGLTLFTVTEDATNSAWNAAAVAYIRPLGAASINVPVQAAIAGVSGNVQAGTITLLGQSVGGIDTVTNAAPFTNGVDQESDAALKARFRAFLASLSRATVAACTAAALAVQAGLTVALQENTAPDGTPRLGFFTLVVDDGSGSPPQTLLTSVYSAVNAVRAASVSFAVIGPSVVGVTVSGTISVAAGASNASAVAAAEAAITAYFESLGVGIGMSTAKAAVAVFNSSATIQDQSLSFNGGTAALTAGPWQVLRVIATNITASGGV